MDLSTGTGLLNANQSVRPPRRMKSLKLSDSSLRDIESGGSCSSPKHFQNTTRNASPPPAAQSTSPRRAVSFESGVSPGISMDQPRHPVFNAQAAPFQPPHTRRWSSEAGSISPSATKSPKRQTSSSGSMFRWDMQSAPAPPSFFFQQGSPRNIIDGKLVNAQRPTYHQLIGNPSSQSISGHFGSFPAAGRRVVSSTSYPISSTPFNTPWSPGSHGSPSGTPSSQISDPMQWQSTGRVRRARKFDSYPDLTILRASRDSSAYHSLQNDVNNGMSHGLYDPYAASSSPLPSHAQPHASQVNPYAQDATSNGHSSYFPTNQFAQPLQYHLYASFGPHKEDLPAYQRSAHDFFISDTLREELQRKSAATLQLLPSKCYSMGIINEF